MVCISQLCVTAANEDFGKSFTRASSLIVLIYFLFSGAAGWSISSWRWSTGYLTWRWLQMSGITLKSPPGCSRRCLSSLSVRSDSSHKFYTRLKNLRGCLLNTLKVFGGFCVFNSSRRQTTRTSCTLHGRFGRVGLLCGRYTPLDWDDGIWWGMTLKSKFTSKIHECVFTVAEIINLKWNFEEKTFCT